MSPVQPEDDMSTLTAYSHHGHGRPLVFEQRPLLTGIAVGIGSLIPHAFLPPQASLGFAAVLIGLIAGVYIWCHAGLI
jgi:hypothetical protein